MGLLLGVELVGEERFLEAADHLEVKHVEVIRWDLRVDELPASFSESCGEVPRHLDGERPRHGSRG